jgi:hypothetical protein
MTLYASLEALVQLGEDYLLVGVEEEWRASDLLAYLQGERPDLLDLPVALVPPDATGAGVVVEVDLAGEPRTEVPLYRIERRKPTVYPL